MSDIPTLQAALLYKAKRQYDFLKAISNSSLTNHEYTLLLCCFIRYMNNQDIDQSVVEEFFEGKYGSRWIAKLFSDLTARGYFKVEGDVAPRGKRLQAGDRIKKYTLTNISLRILANNLKI